MACWNTTGIPTAEDSQSEVSLAQAEEVLGQLHV
jgi:hypothetical protein